MSIFETSLDGGRVVMGPADEKDDADRDPVCGMDVSPDGPIRTDFQGQTYAFCSDECRQKFLAQPQAFLKAGSEKTSERTF